MKYVKSRKLLLFNHKRGDFWFPNFGFKRSLFSNLWTKSLHTRKIEVRQPSTIAANLLIMSQFELAFSYAATSFKVVEMQSLVWILPYLLFFQAESRFEGKSQKLSSLPACPFPYMVENSSTELTGLITNSAV